MFFFFFFWSLIETSVSQCVVFRIFNSSIKFSLAFKPLHAVILGMNLVQVAFT